jgi:hypothetical protein
MAGVEYQISGIDRRAERALRYCSDSSGYGRRIGACFERRLEVDLSKYVIRRYRPSER